MSKDNDLTDFEKDALDAIVDYTRKTRDTELSICGHGGYRPGAGRKPTGRKRLVLSVTEDERAKIIELLAKIRSAK